MSWKRRDVHGDNYSVWHLQLCGEPTLLSPSHLSASRPAFVFPREPTTEEPVVTGRWVGEITASPPMRPLGVVVDHRRSSVFIARVSPSWYLQVSKWTWLTKNMAVRVSSCHLPELRSFPPSWDVYQWSRAVGLYCMTFQVVQVYNFCFDDGFMFQL